MDRTSTLTEVANLALTKLAEATVSSIDSTDPRAVVCRRVLPHLLRKVQGEGRQDTLAATLVMASRDVLRRQVACAGYDTPQDQFACKNPNADGSFATLKIDWRHTHSLPAKWSGLLRVAGQLSSQPLVSNEQYALGGHETIRGYLESGVTGDRGLMFSTELQSPNWLAGSKGNWLTEIGRAHV